MGLFDNLQRTARTAGRTASRASRFRPPSGGRRGGGSTRSRAVAPARRARARQSTGQRSPQQWSNLMLQSVKSVTDPMGNIMHTVKVMDEEEKKEQLEAATERLDPGREFGAELTKPGDPGTMRKVMREERRRDAATAQRRGRAERMRNLVDRQVDTTQLTSGDVADMTDALSTKEYNALTTRQRAAVDYNTMLVDAVTKDLENQDEYADLSGTKREARYNRTVQQLFGKDRGSDVFAPETVAVLKQLAYNPTLDKVIGDKLADLDDYLGLKATVTEADLPSLEGISNRGRANILNPGNIDRSVNVNRYADMAEELAGRLAKSRPMLQNLSESAVLGRYGTGFDSSKIGGINTEPEGFLGFNPPKWETGPDGQPITDEFGQNIPANLDTYFQQVFENLGLESNRGNEDKILGEASRILKPDELEKFFQYADIRTRDMETYGLPTGRNEQGAKFKTPQQFRKELGLDRLRGEE